MSESENGKERSESPTPSAAVDQLTTVSEALPTVVLGVTTKLRDLELESRVLRNGWVIYAIDMLGPDVAVRPAREEGGTGPCITACAVWEISEGAYRWVRPIVESLDERHADLDFTYEPAKGTVWVSQSLGGDLFVEEILEAMWLLGDACAETWREIAALGLGRRFHSAWLSEDLRHGEKSLAQLRRELAAGAAPGQASFEEPRAEPGTDSGSAAVA